MKTNKFVNFILEISQVFMVFLGVYSAIMCSALSLALPVNRLAATLILLGASFLFYGFFTVLETFRHGKIYGMLGLTLFYVMVFFRFRSMILKGVVTTVNIYLKAFMSYTQSNLTLLSNKGFENQTAGVGYCVSLFIILLAVYLIALISCFFYRKRRSSVYVVATLGFFLVPVTLGKVGYFSNVVTYIFTSLAVIGTRHLRSDATDKRMRQKLSLVLLATGVLVGTLSYVVVSPERYQNNLADIVEVKNSVLAFTTWDKDDVLTWFREYFNGDAMEYGKIGKKNSVNRTGKTLMKMSGDFDVKHGIYLRGFMGVEYEENRWRQVNTNREEYEKQKANLEKVGLSAENWHVMLRNQIGESHTTGNAKIWNTGKIKIRNLAFGYGNYLVPYYPTTAFVTEAGRTKVAVPGVEYETEYFPALSPELRQGFSNNAYRLADNEYWTNSQATRDTVMSFVRKYYLQVPEEITGLVDDYKTYLNSQDGLLDKFNQGATSVYSIVEETRNYIMMDTKYTLSPGRTPKGQDAVVYFLKENKKGYCIHYATAATVLLRSVGIPTRYVEGVYVSKERLADLASKQSEVVVTDKDLHAWVEVYQENYGFVPVEVTPGMGEEEAEKSNVENEEDTEKPDSEQPEGGEGTLPLAATPTPVPEDDMTFEDIETDDYNHDEEVPSEDETPQEDVSDAKESQKDDKEKEENGIVWWKIVLIVVAFIVLFVAVMELQRQVRVRWYKRQLKGKKMRQQILMQHHHLEVAFARKSVHYQGQDVEEYATQLATAYGMKQEDMQVYVSLLYCAAFSQNAFTKEQVRAFRHISRDIRHCMYAEVKGIRKLYYMYILCL